MQVEVPLSQANLDEAAKSEIKKLKKQVSSLKAQLDSKKYEISVLKHELEGYKKQKDDAKILASALRDFIQEHAPEDLEY